MAARKERCIDLRAIGGESHSQRGAARGEVAEAYGIVHAFRAQGMGGLGDGHQASGILVMGWRRGKPHRLGVVVGRWR